MAGHAIVKCHLYALLFYNYSLLIKINSNIIDEFFSPEIWSIRPCLSLEFIFVMQSQRMRKKGQPYSIRRKEIKVLIVLPSFTRRGRLRDGVECWPSAQISSESEPRPQIIQQQPKVVALWWKFGNRGTSWRCFWSIGSSSCWGSVRVSAVTPSSQRKETDRPASLSLWSYQNYKEE